MAYNIVVNYLPSGASFYVRGAADNAASIEAGEEVTLNITADGVFYTLLKKTSSVVVTGADMVSWTTASPYTSGALVINNAISDVTIDITSKQVIVPTVVPSPFQINSKAPIDTRIVLTKAQMLETQDALQPDVYFALCKDDQKLYIYNKSLVADENTGKFRSIEEYLTFSSTEGAKEAMAEAVTTSITESTEVQEAISTQVATEIQSVVIDGGEIE